MKTSTDLHKVLDAQDILSNLPSAIVLLSLQGDILFANQVYADCLQQDVDDILQRNLMDLVPSAYVDYQHAIELLQQGQSLTAFEYRFASRYYWVSTQNYYDANGELESILLCGTDITALKQVEQHLMRDNHKLRQLSEFDHLTGLLNRRAFDQQLFELNRQSSHLVVMILDIDNFKMINDHYGHDFGDTILQQLAQLLAEVSERSVGVHLYRFGGEEFVVLLPNIHLSQACQLAEQYRSAVAQQHFGTHSQCLKLSISCGLAQGQQCIEPKAIFACADQALYEAKRQQKNCIYYYCEHDMQRYCPERLSKKF